MNSPASHTVPALALFDFDGTVTRTDTMFAFIRFTHGTLRMALGIWLLAPLLTGVKLGIVGKTKGKETLLRLFYRGWDIQRFREQGKAFCINRLPSLLRTDALEKLRWHKQEGHRIILVSASAEDWVGPWAEQEEIEFLCTRLEIRNGRLTGKIQGKNCNGPEKVERVKNTLSVDTYPVIYAYGDTSGDRAMLAIATQPYYRLFHA
jgi:HAD superfamily hydrolase (TIGR01490 family)